MISQSAGDDSRGTMGSLVAGGGDDDDDDDDNDNNKDTGDGDEGESAGFHVHDGDPTR